jgi:outer membrane protein
MPRWTIVLTLTCLPASLAAQDLRSPDEPWTLRVSAVMSGSSHDSDSAGYKVYSGIALEGGIARALSRTTSLELSARTESREVNGPATDGRAARLGSLEMLPVNLMARWSPLGGRDARLRPHAGVGVNFTDVWEKSGALDSSESRPSWKPVFQLGVAVPFTPRAELVIDAKWHALALDIQDFAPAAPSVRIDPMSFGIGLGVGF